jgi:hypothetical protein
LARLAPGAIRPNSGEFGYREFGYREFRVTHLGVACIANNR